jgi:hypothetical protein
MPADFVVESMWRTSKFVGIEANVGCRAQAVERWAVRARLYDRMHFSLTCRKECDAQPKLQLLQIDDARMEHTELVETECALRRADEKKAREPEKWYGEVDCLFEELKELNRRMANLGMPEKDVADVEALRAEYNLPKQTEKQVKADGQFRNPLKSVSVGIIADVGASNKG